MSPVHFGKMYHPIRNKKTEGEKEVMPRTNTKKNNIEQKEEEDERVANYIITTNPKYKNIELPNMIKIKDPFPGEVPIWVKRGFPKLPEFTKKEKKRILTSSSYQN